MKLGVRHVLGIALLVSLGLNVLLGGVMIGRWVGDGPMHGGRGSPGFDREAAREALTPAAQRIVDEHWARQKPKVHAAFEAVREARREIRRLLGADELDRAALEAAQATLSARWAEARGQVASGITELAFALPADERKRYFAAGATRGHGPRSDEPGVPSAPPPE